MLGMVKIGEAAGRLGITTTELRDSADRGEIRCTRTPGGIRYFSKHDLGEFALKVKGRKSAESGLKIGEVAEMFGLPVVTIASWAERGYLSYTRTARGTRIFSVDEVESLINRMRGELNENKVNGR